jgi:hypothetical protein
VCDVTEMAFVCRRDSDVLAVGARASSTSTSRELLSRNLVPAVSMTFDIE